MPPAVSIGCRVSQPLPADAWPDPYVVFHTFFPGFLICRYIGSLFQSGMNALISDGSVHPSEPTPTQAIASSMSGCLLTRATPSFSFRSLLRRCSSPYFGINSSASQLDMKRITTATRNPWLIYQSTHESSLPRLALLCLPWTLVDPHRVSPTPRSG